MTVYLTGDLHGGFDMAKLRENGARTCQDDGAPGKGDYLIVCGDFGFPWDFSAEECDDIAWLESRPYRVLFIDGNHERFDHWAERPMEEWHGGHVQRLSPGSPILRLMRSEVYEIDGATYFTLGGATSPDKAWRHPYVDWWPVELPDERNFEEAREVLGEHGWKVDYVITHTCADRMLRAALGPGRNPDEDRLTHFLDEVEDRLTYRHWYFGHFHRSANLDDHHTVLYDAIVRAGETVPSGWHDAGDAPTFSA